MPFANSTSRSRHASIASCFRALTFSHDGTGHRIMTTQPPDWPEFTGPELCRLQAHELVALLKNGEVSPRDCLNAAFARIEAVEPTINAMPTSCHKRAYAAADAIGVKSIDDGFHMQGTEYINGNFYSRDMGLLESAGSVATGSLQFVGTGLAGIDGLNAIGSFGKSFLQISTRKVFEAAPSRGVGAADDLVIDSYGILRRRSDIPGQAHHLNQNAAFQSLIPRSEGVSIKLEGNAITGVGTQHYIAHESMESFWDIYRRGGMDAGNLPTISLYNRSLYNGLQEAGLSPEEALRAVRAAKAQQLREGLRGSDFVPRLPNRINQVPRGGN